MTVDKLNTTEVIRAEEECICGNKPWVLRFKDFALPPHISHQGYKFCAYCRYIEEDGNKHPLAGQYARNLLMMEYPEANRDKQAEIMAIILGGRCEEDDSNTSY